MDSNCVNTRMKFKLTYVSDVVNCKKKFTDCSGHERSPASPSPSGKSTRGFAPRNLHGEALLSRHDGIKCVDTAPLDFYLHFPPCPSMSPCGNIAKERRKKEEKFQPASVSSDVSFSHPRPKRYYCTVRG